jgi:chaperonin GroEL (HSP60 family)
LTVRSSLEEGVIPGAGVFYLSLQEELTQWSSLNLVGDEFFASFIVHDSLAKPFSELCENANLSKFSILQKIQKLGYPYGFDMRKQQIVNCFQAGLIDSAKSVRAVLWNSLSIVATILISE